MDWMDITGVLDDALDRSVVLGYTKLGPLLRRAWWPADPGHKSMAGKRVVVTGATAGIGEAMAGAFAGLGATVHLLGRDEGKVKRSAGAIRRSVPGAMVIEEVCDISDLDAVRAWCDDISGWTDALHGLVHNAIIECLLPLLRNAGGASVVFMSSGGMYTAPLSVDDMESESGPYDGVRVYARTKRMQVVLADAWAKRLADCDIRVQSMHSGWVGTPGVAESLPMFRKLTRPLLRDTRDGAECGSSPPARPPPGHFWHDRAQRPTTFGWQRPENQDVAARFLETVSSMTETMRFAGLAGGAR